MNSCNPTTLVDISQSQQERLFHIDFKLRFLGTVNRNDLVNRFAIKEAAATRDIALYKEPDPNNITYNTKAKTYIGTEQFQPLYQYQGSQALSALCYGLGDDHVAGSSSLITTESSTQLNFSNLDVLAEITKAIHQKKALIIGRGRTEVTLRPPHRSGRALAPTSGSGVETLHGMSIHAVAQAHGLREKMK